MLTLKLYTYIDVSSFNIPVEVLLTTGRGTPIMLPKGVLIRGGFNDNTTSYYYIEISKEEEGEIALDFKRGSGIMFAKLVSKDDIVINPKSWREKVILPTENDYDKELEYNYATQKIKYKKSYTEKCGGICFIIVGVTSKFKFEGYEAYFASEYNIMVKYIEKGEENLSKVSINIPLNEFINGVLEDTSSNKYYDAYNLDIFDSYEGIEIEYKSLNAKMVISWDNKYKIESSCEIMPDKEVQILKLNSNGRCKGLPLPRQLNGTNFKFTIFTDKIDNDNSPYYFRVRPIYKGRPHIIDINSDQETACEFNEENYCYFLVPLLSYDEISTIVLYADTTHDINIYAKTVESELYHACGDNYPCYEDIIPKQKSNEIATRNKFITSKNCTFDKSNYIIVSIYSRNAKKISVASTMRTYIHSTNPTLNSIQLVYISPNNKRIININRYIQNITIIHLQGKGILTMNNEKKEISSGQLTLVNTADNTKLQIEPKKGKDSDDIIENNPNKETNAVIR